jgi:hypothetical protein
VNGALGVGGVRVLTLNLWGRQGMWAERRAVLVAATGTGLVVAGANALAAARGWWGSPTYALPLPVLAGLYGLWPALLVALVLAGYRWLLAHARRPRLAYGVLLLALFAPFVLLADRWALGAGRLAFGGGYALWHDVLLGQALLWLPVLLYEAARRRWRPPAG